MKFIEAKNPTGIPVAIKVDSIVAVVRVAKDVTHIHTTAGTFSARVDYNEFMQKIARGMVGKVIKVKGPE